MTRKKGIRYYATPKRVFAEKLCAKHRIDGNNPLGDRAVAKLLYNSRYKKDFSHYEHARGMVRQIRGHLGDECRTLLMDKSLTTPPNHSRTYLQTKDSEEYLMASKKKLVKSKYYIVTWAQNNTDVHSELWRNISAYAKFLGASIHVILGRYKNPTRLNDGDDEEHWAQEVLPYADARRHSIHKNLTLLSDIKVQPTASTPLTGMESMSGLNSAIIGHPKMQLDTIPALEGYEPKLIMTTGAVTEKNYSDSKAGKRGDFHHTYGFCIVEIKNENVFIPRQVTALNNGSFSDLIYNVKDGKVKRIKEISYANLGDKHIGDHCQIVERQQKRWLEYFKPKATMVHDIFNGTSVNHHEEHDPIKKFHKEQTGANMIKREVEYMFDWIDSMKQYNLVIVSSNHNDWLDKYIKRKDWKYDIKNAMEYMEYSKILLSGKATKGLIAYLIDQRFGKKVRTLSRNDSFRINDIELAQHGDIGTNGSRGGLIQFKKLSTKMDVGDSHVPRRLDGVMYVGTSTKLRVGYNIGASSWRNADIICHTDGKRQHIIYMGDAKEFTTFKF